jgi:hypothetical protein
MALRARPLAAIAIVAVATALRASTAAGNTRTLHPLILAQENPDGSLRANSSAAPSALSAASADRRTIDQWFASLAGDFKIGASYWASQGSSPKPGACHGSGTGSRAPRCLAAQRVFAATDVPRKAEPEYWRDWNSQTRLDELPTPPASVATTAATEKAPPSLAVTTVATEKANTITAARASQVSVLNGTFAGSYSAATTQEMRNLTLSDFAIAIAADPFINDLDITFVARITNNSVQMWKVGICIRYYDSRNLQIDDSSGDRVNIGPDQSEMSNGTTYLAPKLWPKVQTIKVYVAQDPRLDSPSAAMSPMLTLSRRPAP